MSWPSEIHADIARFIDEPRGGPARVEALALALARWQRAHNPAYAALFDGEPGRIEEIPAVPVALFREVPLTCFSVEEAGAVFRTSGTTGQARGVHRLRDTRMYDRSAHAWFRRRFPDAPRRVVSLCPPGLATDPASDSSLGHMVDSFASEVVHTFRDGVVDTDAAWAALAPGGATFLATTAFSLDALLGTIGDVPLDPRSLVMVTGGFKGRRVRLDSEGLYAVLGERLGAPRVVGEYGMTELSSQLWTDAVPAGEVPGAFVAPPWLRVYTVDPVTALPTAGEGVLRFVDLANVDSVVAIETMDLGVVTRDDAGDRVTLRGRLQGAEARGCSMRAEEGLERARGAG